MIKIKNSKDLKSAVKKEILRQVKMAPGQKILSPKVIAELKRQGAKLSEKELKELKAPLLKKLRT